MRATRVDVIVGCLLLVSFAQLCSAQVECKVTQDGEQTTYTVRDVPQDAKTSDCEFSWANSSHFVLANNEDKLPELVKTNSITTLIMSKCIFQIVYTRSCMAERERYTATCTIDCTGNAGSLKEEVISHGSIAVIVVFFVAVGLCGIFCYLFRNKCPRIDRGIQA